MKCHYCGIEHGWENQCEGQKKAFLRMQKRNAQWKRQCMKEIKPEWPPKDYLVKRWKYKGLDCAISRGGVALCGYVKVPVGHPCEKLWSDDLDVEVHGGVTFRGRVKEGSWFGFDCGHAGDYIDWSTGNPEIDEKLKALNKLGGVIRERIWTLEAVQKETERMACQLAALLKPIRQRKRGKL